MGWYGSGWGGATAIMWIFMGLFWIALLVLIGWLVVRLLPGSSSGHGRVSSAAGQVESPEQVLDRLFATGEIDEQTYRSRRTALAEMRRSS
jgi:putative membrane protein